MKAPQIYRLERMVYNGWYESGMEAAHKRKNDSNSVVKAFLDNVPQVPDPVLTLLRFEPFIRGWDSTIEFEREEAKTDDADGKRDTP